MQALKTRTRQDAIDAGNLSELLDDYIAECFEKLKYRSAYNYKLSLAPFRAFWAFDGPAHGHKLDKQTFVRVA